MRARRAGTRRTFAPVAQTGEGEVRVKAGAQDLPISEDWQLRLAVGQRFQRFIVGCQGARAVGVPPEPKEKAG